MGEIQMAINERSTLRLLLDSDEGKEFFLKKKHIDLKDMRRSIYEEPEEENFNDISDALRNEFISHITLGITASLKEEETRESNDFYLNANYDVSKTMFKYHSKDSGSRINKENSPFVVKERNLRERSHSRLNPIFSSETEFLAYECALFRRLKLVLNLTTKSFAQSMSGKTSAMKKNFSEGASGSFFYFSVDKKYIIKTLIKSEFKFLKSILKSYVDHMEKNPTTRICRFFGLYSIKMYNHVEYIVVMNNFLLDDKYKIDEIYDLKGSRINRHAKAKKSGRPLFKDNDLKKNILLQGKKKLKLFNQLVADSKWMCEHNIMDYSLLVGVHNCTEIRNEFTHCGGTYNPPLLGMTTTTTTTTTTNINSESHASNIKESYPEQNLGSTITGEPDETSDTDILEDTFSARVIVGPGIYNIGIIDVLQRWTLWKRMEQWAKIIFRCHCRDWGELSCVEPILYSRRFISMLGKILEIEQDLVDDAISSIELQ